MLAPLAEYIGLAKLATILHASLAVGKLADLTKHSGLAQINSTVEHSGLAKGGYSSCTNNANTILAQFILPIRAR